jgi:hypothetical protein
MKILKAKVLSAPRYDEDNFLISIVALNPSAGAFTHYYVSRPTAKQARFAARCFREPPGPRKTSVLKLNSWPYKKNKGKNGN